MHKIKQVGVLSFAKILGVSGAAVGLIVGVFYGLIIILISIVGGAASDQGGAGVAAFGIFMGVLAMVGIPLAAGVMYFIFGLIYGLILNLVLAMAGGLEIELEAPAVYKPMP